MKVLSGKSLLVDFLNNDHYIHPRDQHNQYDHHISSFLAEVFQMSYIGSGLLLMNYVFAIGLSLFNPTWFKQKIMITMHAVLATYLIAKTKKLEKAGFSQSAVQTYYQDVWKLFYSEYLLLPFI